MVWYISDHAWEEATPGEADDNVTPRDSLLGGFLMIDNRVFLILVYGPASQCSLYFIEISLY